jgi:hypothetical protein
MSEQFGCVNELLKLMLHAKCLILENDFLVLLLIKKKHTCFLFSKIRGEKMFTISMT